MISVDVDVAVVSPNRLMGEHFRSRHWRRKKERRAVRKVLSGKAPPPGPWLVVLTRVASRLLDSDNLSASFKAPRDEVADWLGVDDRSPVVRWHYEQAVQRVRSARKPGAPAFRVWCRIEVATLRPARVTAAASAIGSRCGG